MKDEETKFAGVSAFIRLNASRSWDYPDQTHPIVDTEDSLQLNKFNIRISLQFMALASLEFIGSAAVGFMLHSKMLTLNRALISVTVMGLLPCAPLYILYRDKQDFNSRMEHKYSKRGLDNSFLWKFHERLGDIS